ncbi:GRB2-associated-binding protein 1 isoform X2 [Aplysia californica]|uniref:GRB2-associated-binding protein 1 isoform X2 n=1 Tax=Aplysia californica TaxID=6500 RepID=A0ABM1VR13_APLCA|nr:GRB2-associated-binding protein 1 isoform X2 [Aplysia californica]
MKRGKASTKMTTVVHSGWMTKSPPEGKLHTPFKIFRSQWKKRFFVLSKPSGSLPDQYELHYFKDDRCSNKKGSIDLEQCDQIISSLDSDQFPNLLSIKTVYRHKWRTYYLAADSQQEMSSWVEWLCHVCGLKQEEQHIPEAKPPTSANGGTISGSAGAPRPVSPHSGLGIGAPVTTSPPSHNMYPLGSVGATSSSHSFASESRDHGGSRSPSPPSYIMLEECKTGQPHTSEDVPNYVAPPPPVKAAPNVADEEHDDVFLKQHVPAPREVPSRGSASFNVYQVPPARNGGGRFPADDDDSHRTSYDVPPPRRDVSPRMNNVGGGWTDSVVSSSSGRPNTPDSYDYPPPRLDSTTSSEGGDLPPERPPRMTHHVPSPYQNLPSDLNTVIAPPRTHQTTMSIGYDIPRSSLAGRGVVPPPRPCQTSTPSPASSSTLSTITPPPPKPHRPSTSAIHAYLNAPTKRPSSGELKSGGSDTDTSSDRGGAGGGSDQVDASDRFTPPAIPPPRHGSGTDALDGPSVSPHSALYQTPPPSSSSASSSSSGAPARPPARAPPQVPSVSSISSDNSTSQVQDEGCSIFSTQRTRSFKRQHNVNNNIPQNARSRTLPISVPVPAPRPILNSRPRESVSDDEEEATHHPISLLHSMPVPAEPDGELKYIDIDLAVPHSGQDTPRASQGHRHSHAHTNVHSHTERAKESATEYREIDFLKTQALSEAKKVKEKERQNDDHNG